MASDDHNAEALSAFSAEAENTPTKTQQQPDELSSTPVEMSQLPSQSGAQPNSVPSQPQSTLINPETQNEQSQAVDGASDRLQTQSESAHPPPSRPMRARQDSEAIGPPAEDTATASSYLQQNVNPDAGPAVLITLILLNGARHPYKIDQKYLKKRNVASEEDSIDPYSISVYTMKELIWRDWRDEWDPRPTIPGAIRLIYFGKLLDDKQTLSDCRFRSDMPNAVHMSVRPQDFADDDDHTKSSKLGSTRIGRGEEGDAEPICRCCIVM